MSAAEFTVRFRGDVPDGLKVGDVLQISGAVTVHSITGELVDVRALGDEGAGYLVGDTNVDLYSNRLGVSR